MSRPKTNYHVIDNQGTRVVILMTPTIKKAAEIIAHHRLMKLPEYTRTLLDEAYIESEEGTTISQYVRAAIFRDLTEWKLQPQTMPPTVQKVLAFFDPMQSPQGDEIINDLIN